jgi:hypothetical protein
MFGDNLYGCGAPWVDIGPARQTTTTHERQRCLIWLFRMAVVEAREGHGELSRLLYARLEEIALEVNDEPFGVSKNSIYAVMH